MTERADKLTSPPVVGRFYLVPAIQWSFSGTWNGNSDADYLKWWPVWGRKHDDLQFFNFPHKHYHVDPRFLTKRQWKEFEWSNRSALDIVQGKPLNHIQLPRGPSRPTLRRMKCTLAHSAWQHGDKDAPIKINRAFKDKQCTSSKLGWICPHQRFPLGSVAVVDGVITCPLHGLRVDAATGKAIGPCEAEAA